MFNFCSLLVHVASHARHTDLFQHHCVFSLGTASLFTVIDTVCIIYLFIILSKAHRLCDTKSNNLMFRI